MSKVLDLLGSHSGYRRITASETLTAIDAGNYISVSGSGLMITLPDAAALGLRPGFGVTVQCETGSTATLVSQNGAMQGPNSDNLTANYPMRGTTCTDATWTGSAWRLHGGSGVATLDPLQGYQRLPSGILIQWGSGVTDAGGALTVNWQVAFSTACYSVLANRKGDAGGAGGGSVIHVGTPGTTSCSFYSRSASALIGSQPFFWLAIGN